jgi:orotate phosphoribosyltransferase
LVDVPIHGKKILILSDVITSGTAIRHAIHLIKAAGGKVVGVIQCLDKEEIGNEGGCTLKEVEDIIGEGQEKSILEMRLLIAYSEKNGGGENLAKMQKRWQQYSLHD